MRTRDGRTRPIPRGHVERLGRLPGRRIACRAGTAWLTLDGDRRDIVLRTGESFLVDKDVQVLVCALDGEPAVIDLLEALPREGRDRRRASLGFSAWRIAAVWAGVAGFGLGRGGRARPT